MNTLHLTEEQRAWAQETLCRTAAKLEKVSRRSAHKIPYTTVNGSEMSTPFSGNQSYQPNKAAVLVDGQAADLEAITLTDANGNGYTYFKVRDLGQALGFDVTWDSAQGAILIDTTKPYSG